ncbi:MAG: FHA domain-containing protein, partial [Bdellovibrionota bacterium]
KAGDVIALGPYLVKLSNAAGAAASASISDEPLASPLSDLLTPAPTPEEPGPLASISADLSAHLTPPPEAASGDSADFLLDVADDSPPAEALVLDQSGTSGDMGHGSSISEESSTRAGGPKLKVYLTFPPGSANHETFEIIKNEVAIGRGSECDIILKDKKSSRKHTIIRRAGTQFTVQDTGTTNGTFVNGERIETKEIESGDKIRIGGTEFEFKAINPDFEAQAQNFASVPVEEVPPIDDPAMDAALPMEVPANNSNSPELLQQAPLVPSDQQFAGIPGIAGIPGTGGAAQSNSLLAKFRAMPKQRQLIYGAVGLAAVYFLLLYEDTETLITGAKNGQAPVAQGSGAPVLTFESLSPQQKVFIASQHTLAFDLYKNREYEKSLFEIQKIFQLVPDYKDSREIERYAQEGKRKLEALEEEKRQKEELARLKAKVTELLSQVSPLMEKKQYEQAKNSLSEILAIDPDNAQVALWQKEIQDFEDLKASAEQESKVQSELNKRGWDVYSAAAALRKKGKCHSAMRVSRSIANVGALDRKLMRKAKGLIAECNTFIASKRDPILASAEELEQAGDLGGAFKKYQLASRVDPPHPDGPKGMERVRGVLHEKARLLYTEAVLSESYSDFVNAKKRFKEILAGTPDDDVYFERAKRKLSNYIQIGEAAEGGS